MQKLKVCGIAILISGSGSALGFGFWVGIAVQGLGIKIMQEGAEGKRVLSPGGEQFGIGVVVYG